MTDARRTTSRTAPAGARAATQTAPLTLRAALAARHAQNIQAALADSGASTTLDVLDPLDHATLAEVAQTVAQIELTPAKLALLASTLAGDEIAAAARRLTSTQAQALLHARPAKAPRPAEPESGGAPTVATLDALTPDAWSDFVRWLLEQEGARIEPRPFAQHEGLVAWRGEQGERRLVICAWRPEPTTGAEPDGQPVAQGWPLHEHDVRRMAALAAGEPGARLVIVSVAEATVGARLTAQRLGGAGGVSAEVRLLDRPALAEALGRLATAYAREQERAQDVAKTRAKAATAARKKLLAALTALDEQAKARPGAQRATGRAAVRKAAAQVEQAHRQAAQALIAWETLLAEWIACFGERPARDGALILSAEPSRYTELAERADHLKKPLLDALRALAKTPGDGDVGYAGWRVALGEELAARCAALRARAQWIDPAHWQDYAAAVNDHALQAATRAENAAVHAGARASVARSQLVERVGAL